MRVAEVDWTEVAAEYLAGASYVQLARRWGRSPSGIRWRLVQLGVELEGQTRLTRNRAAAAERRDRARQLYRDGSSVEEVATRTGYTVDFVLRLIGPEARRNESAARRDRRQSRDARAVELYQAGHTIAETAEIMGMARSQIGRIVKEAGVSRPRGPAAGRPQCGSETKDPASS